MKPAELRSKSIDELNSELMSLLREQFNLRFQQNAKSHLIKNVKTSIARVKTILREKKKA